ncbi:hypothetical protein [Streptomyces sp. NPDC101150]|uniref:hypothetical protein n=1 Tax=Streptomyces sp. NPDC101150 TaxID=3366114 RepID=UPI0038177835
MREPSRVHPLAALLVLLGIGCLYAGVSIHSRAGSALFLLSFVLFMTAQIYHHRGRQRDWFHQTFRTYENFRAEAIVEARRVRHEKGDAAVVRHLRILYPLLPMPVITRLIKEL